LDITEIVRAQQAQKNFVQTLTKTFVTLSIGLAIFDRNRQLMLFNPALIDLTALTADFLSTRPNLLTAFDKLWDN
jgi:PAS domain-containing protein